MSLVIYVTYVVPFDLFPFFVDFTLRVTVQKKESFLFLSACTALNALPCPKFNDPTWFYPYPDWEDPRMVYVCNSSGMVRTRRCRDDEIYNPFNFRCVSARVVPVQLTG